MSPNGDRDDGQGEEGLSEEEFNKLREEFDSRLDAYMKEWEASLREAMERG
jgi:hypothetical protein